MYILEGATAQYYKECSVHCEPSRYVHMDDPHHAAAHRENLTSSTRPRFGAQSLTHLGGMGLSVLQHSNGNVTLCLLVEQHSSLLQ